VLGLSLGGRVRLRPGKELVKIEIKIGGDSSSGSTDFLDNAVFHIYGS
jgi:hypothetical protein